MTINEMHFSYAGQSSKEFGVIMCNFDNSSSSSNDESSNLITTKTPFKETWDYLYKEDAEPLKYNITVAKENGECITSADQRLLKKWLCKNKRNWLQIEQDDLLDVWYYCILINPTPINAGNETAGFQFEVICDCNHAWSHLFKKTYSTENGKSFNHFYISDYDDYILYPTLKISPLSNGNISITNLTTNTKVFIANCIKSEIITLDCKNDIFTSSENRVLLDYWNKGFLEFIDGNNKLVFEGSFKLDVSYRLPIRIGG